MRAALLAALAASCAPAWAADTTPFYRMGDPFILPAGPTATQYQIAQPMGSTSYRMVNPCGVDIRIKTVASMTSPVTVSTGTRFLARTAEVVASSPALTVPRIVSIITTADPGPAGCSAELSYGTGQ